MSNVDLTREEQRILQLKHARRLELRKEFLKQIHNPYKHAHGEGTLVRKIHYKNITSKLCHNFFLFSLLISV